MPKIELHTASAAGFAARLAELEADSLIVTTVVGAFANHEAAVSVDLVHFVHSLYYMADLGATLDHALAMLRPNGLLLLQRRPGIRCVCSPNCSAQVTVPACGTPRTSLRSCWHGGWRCDRRRWWRSWT